MNKKNHTRSALFTSIISLLLCVSMLVGTTFAWFTDEVTSDRNTIAAGNLDVELMANDVEVDGSTVLFDDVDHDLWEPGAVAYENLQVKNVGTLALQYTLTLDVLNETVVDGKKLSDVIKVGIVDGGVNSVDRDEVVNNITNWVALKDFAFGMNGVKLEAGEDSDVFGVVLYWQPDTDYSDGNHDNYYNMNNENKDEVLKLDIGVSLIATQVVHEDEKDSFGDDYDSEATLWKGATNIDWYLEDPDATEFVIDTVEELAGLAAIVNGTATAPVATYAAGGATVLVDSFKNKTVKLGADISLGSEEWAPIGTSTNKFEGTFDGQGYTISNLKVTGYNSDVGLFGFTTDGEIKNLTVKNAKVSGRLNVGVVAGTPYTSKYTNISVIGHVEVNGMAYVGGVAGKNAYANWTDITVNVDDTSYVNANSIENGRAYRTYVGGVVGFNGEGGHTFKNITSNIDVIGTTCDVGGAFGIAHYGNQFDNVTVTGDVTITDAAEAADAEEMGGIAGVWHNGGADVVFNNCTFTGTLTANITEGVDLTDNLIHGAAYSATGAGNVNITLNGGHPVSDVAGLKEMLDGDKDVILVDDITVAAADAVSNAYGATGINIKKGNTFDGNGNSFGVNKWGTWDSAISTTGGMIKNVTINKGMRGVFVNHNSDESSKVILENVIIDGPVYTISCDQGTNQGLEATNCTFNGWTSYAGTIGEVKFVDCQFGEGQGYKFCRPYAPTEFVGCDFAEGYAIDARAAVTFENCTINGVSLTAENLATLVTGNTANATVK